MNCYTFNPLQDPRHFILRPQSMCSKFHETIIIDLTGNSLSDSGATNELFLKHQELKF